METKVIFCDDANGLKEAGEIISRGGLVVFPTETVYGIGADGLNENAIKNIYIAKGRPSDNPLILHTNSIEKAEKIGYINPMARKIFETFSPGPVTVVVKKRDIVPLAATGGLDTVAIRIPSSETARALIEYSGAYIAAPSANISGRPSPTTASHVIEDLSGRVDMIIDGGDADIGIESTVIDTTGDYPVILRPGKVTLPDLQKLFPDASAEKHMKENTEGYKPKSPGMKYKHYAPKAKVIVFEDNAQTKIKAELETIKSSGKKAAVFCRTSSEYDADFTVKWQDSADMARLLFSSLREFDKMGADVILCEAPDNDAMGESVRNRLYKSAGYDIR